MSPLTFSRCVSFWRDAWRCQNCHYVTVFWLQGSVLWFLFFLPYETDTNLFTSAVITFVQKCRDIFPLEIHFLSGEKRIKRTEGVTFDAEVGDLSHIKTSTWLWLGIHDLRPMTRKDLTISIFPVMRSSERWSGNSGALYLLFTVVELAEYTSKQRWDCDIHWEDLRQFNCILVSVLLPEQRFDWSCLTYCRDSTWLDSTCLILTTVTWDLL